MQVTIANYQRDKNVIYDEKFSSYGQMPDT